MRRGSLQSQRLAASERAQYAYDSLIKGEMLSSRVDIVDGGCTEESVIDHHDSSIVDELDAVCTWVRVLRSYLVALQPFVFYFCAIHNLCRPFPRAVLCLQIPEEAIVEIVIVRDVERPSA